MIRVDLSRILPVAQKELEKSLRRVSVAIQNSAHLVTAEWADAIAKTPELSPYERQAYTESLRIRVTGPFAAEIVAESKLAADIESGRPARDMKQYLQTSLRTRVSKSGKHPGQKYLIIPFRHNVPGNTAHAPAMPKEVYAKAKHLSPSNITSMGSRMSATGAIVPRASYNWGGRLPAGVLGPNPKGKTDRYAGMVRMNTSAGRGKSSAYLTFRVMSEHSSGWIIPAKPGLKIAAEVEKKMAPVIKRVIKNAARGRL